MGSSTWIKIMLLSGAVIVWRIIDFSTTTEGPSQTLLILQYTALALAVIALVGSIVMLVRGRADRA